MTYQKSVLFFILIHFAYFGRSQTELEITQATVFESLIEYEQNLNLIHVDSNMITWNQIDTFKFVRYTSSIRGAHRLDTLKISLRFESGWSEFQIQETKRQNTLRITKLKETYSAFMDSVNWRGYKITPSSFQSNVVRHLKMKYPITFTKEEREEIDLITRCPDFLIGNIGVFLECDHTGIDPEEVQNEYVKKLEFIYKDLFDLPNVNFGAKSYE